MPKTRPEDVEQHIDSIILAMTVLDDEELDRACCEMNEQERDRLLDALSRAEAGV